MTVPALLVVLSLASLLPLLGFAIFSLDRFADGLRRLEHDALSARAASISASIDREIRGLITTGQALASSPSLAAGDFRAFDAEARQATRNTPIHVLLIDSSMQQVVNTRVPYGTPLPKTSAPDVVSQVLQSRTPAVSRIFWGKVAGRLVFDVAVPVIGDSAVRHVLVITDEPRSIGRVVQQHILPEGWRASVRDQTGLTFATSVAGADPAQWHFPLQQSAVPALMAHASIQGQRAIVASQVSQQTGWITSVWAPEDVLNAPTQIMWDMLGRAGLLAVAASMLIAYFFSKPFANLIGQIGAAAAAMGRGEPLPPVRTFLREGHAIEEQLRQAEVELRESQRKNSEGKALLDTLMETVPEGITVTSYPGFEVMAESRQGVEWLGYSTRDALQALAQNRASTMFLPDGKTPMTWEHSAVRRASEENRSITGEHAIIERPDGSRMEVEASVKPFHNALGEVIGTVGCWRDVTAETAARRALEEHQRHLQLVLREMTHRAKNLLAVIMAIASQTARRNTTVDEFLAVFSRRVQGLGMSHDLLVRSD